MLNLSNMCIFEGRVSKEPQYSTVTFGTNTVEKAMFSIAVERTLTKEQRNKIKAGDNSIKTADFIPCSLMGAQVQTLRDFFPVGTPIKVEGKYTEYQTTDAQSGQKRYGHIFELESIGFTVQSKNGNGGNSYSGQTNNTQQQQYSQAQHQQQAPVQSFAMFDESQAPF